MGKGRALGCGRVNFRGQVLPESKLITYAIELKRVREGKTVLGVADCEVKVDQKQIYTAEEVKVGLFTNLGGLGDFMRRAVITGMGIVSPLGNNLAETLDSLRSRSGIRFQEAYKRWGSRAI